MADTTIIPSFTLLRGGTVLTHGAGDKVTAVKADVLIRDNVIKRIAADIDFEDDSETMKYGWKEINCINKIISPGFIDTHHHVWQSLMKGRFADDMLLDYMYGGNLQSSNHSPTDIYWGQLAGCLECLDAGTTTVVDHAHLNYSPDHSQAALAASISSGLRSVYCYDLTARLQSWKPFAMSQDPLPSWLMETLSQLAQKAPFGNGRVTLGLAFDLYFLPREMVVDIIQKVRAMGIKLITSHYSSSPIFGSTSPIALLEEYGLLDSSILISHATGATLEDVALLRKSNSHVSTTPSTELQMGMHVPLAFSQHHNIQSHCSLGIDCQCVTSSSIPNEMRLLLQSARATQHQKFLDAGKNPTRVYKTVEDVFNLGTINGARAVGMEAKIGSLKEGKLADIVVFDALSPSMAVAAQTNPVAAIVLHSSVGDVVMTIVDGVIKKDNFTGTKYKGLSFVDVSQDYKYSERPPVKAGEIDEIRWEHVAKEIIKRSKNLNEKIATLDFKEAREGVMKTFNISPENIVDSI